MYKYYAGGRGWEAGVILEDELRPGFVQTVHFLDGETDEKVLHKHIQRRFHLHASEGSFCQKKKWYNVHDPILNGYTLP